MIVTTLDPSLLGDIDMPYSNHPIPDRLMVGHGFKRLRARLTTIATPTAASSPLPGTCLRTASSPACTDDASASTSPSHPASRRRSLPSRQPIRQRLRTTVPERRQRP